MDRKFRITLAIVVASFNAWAQTTPLTKDDTLRGSITDARKWWDLKYYHLKVSVDPAKKELSGSVSITYEVLTPYKEMQVDLQPPLQITKVTADGIELPFRKIGTAAYLVELKKQQTTANINTVEVFYGGHPIEAKNPPWEGGVQWAKTKDQIPFIATSCQGLGSSAWWPCKDHMYDEPDSMLITATVPPGLMDVSNGRLRRSYVNSDSTRSFEWFVKNPINNYGVNINITNYAHFSDTLAGEKGILDLNYYVLPENFEKARVQFKQVKLMLKAFEHWFGPYPFYEDGFKLVETPYLGMEHQSSVTYGNGYQNGYRGRDLSGTGWGLKFDFIIIHESGHEWFANNITYTDIADMWVHEGFTNYSESLYLEFYFGKEAATDYVVGTRQHIQHDTPVIGKYNVNQSGSGDMYSKGGNMLHTIRHAINNDSLFRNILRGLNETFYHKTVTTKQVEEYISKKAGRDFQFVFNQYLRDTRLPVLEYTLDRSGKSIRYRWSNCVKKFDLPVVIQRNGSTWSLKPTTEWQTAKLQNPLSLDDIAYIKRMFYIETRDVGGQNQKK